MAGIGYRVEVGRAYVGALILCDIDMTLSASATSTLLEDEVSIYCGVTIVHGVYFVFWVRSRTVLFRKEHFIGINAVPGANSRVPVFVVDNLVRTSIFFAAGHVRRYNCLCAFETESSSSEVESGSGKRELHRCVFDIVW